MRGGEVVLTGSLRQVYAEPFKCQLRGASSSSSHKTKQQDNHDHYLFLPPQLLMAPLPKAAGLLSLPSRSPVSWPIGDPPPVRKEEGRHGAGTYLLVNAWQGSSWSGEKERGGQLHIHTGLPIRTPKSPTLPTPAEV